MYRRSQGHAEWVRLTERPVKPAEYSLGDTALRKDPELKNYMQLVRQSKDLRGIPMLAVLLKSFRSELFARFIGILVDDRLAEGAGITEYKVTTPDVGGERVLASATIDPKSGYQPVDPPQDISHKSSDKEISFRWKAETDRYYGVNVYRKDSAAGNFKKITADPVILSQAAQSDGRLAYGETFYSDIKVSGGKRYEYFFEAIDFYGAPGKRSEILSVLLPDRQPPAKVDSVFHSVHGRQVTLAWKKHLHEKDLAGYNVYRTNLNDTDFSLVNKGVIMRSQLSLIDSVTKFSSYMYKVSCVDTCGNESVSNPFLVEVYDNEPPRRPTGLLLQADSGKLSLSWKRNTEPDMNGYLVYRTVDRDEAARYVKLTPVPVVDTFYFDRLPANAKNKFLYRIVAVDASLNKSGYSDFAAAGMPDLFPPSSPFIKAVELQGQRNVLLQWLANAEPDLAGYHVFRKSVNGPEDTNYIRLNRNVIDRRVTRFTDRHAEPGVRYVYYLQAQDSSGNVSGYSNGCNFFLRRTNGISMSISDVHIKYNPKKQLVNIGWKVSPADSVFGVIVFRRGPSDNSMRPLTALVQADRISDNSVVKNCEYIYELRAYDRKGDAVRSQKVIINTTEREND